MNLIEARQAVKQYASDHWTTTPIVWPNPVTPGKGPPKQISDPAPHWIALEMEDIRPDTGLGGDGKRLAQDDGMLIASVFAPVMTGDEAVYGIAYAFGELFRMLKLDGLQFFSPRVDAGQRADDDGAWFVVTVTVPWLLLRTV